MNITPIPIEHLSVSKLNMRHGRKAPDTSDLVPSIKEKGLLSPLIVVPADTKDRFDIIAGRRRYFAAQQVDGLTALPCIVLDDQSDADALEISLIENAARCDPDPLSECEAFSKLARKGRSVDAIAVLFATTPKHINQRLALSQLLPGIKSAFRKDKIDAATLQALTLATPQQQSAWLKRFKDPVDQAPIGVRLKHWLMGGQSISTEVALFDLADYPGQIITDLFGDSAYFDDSEAFWALQLAAIDQHRDAYLEAGWSAVEIIPAGTYFGSWNYTARPKSKGGHVIVDIASNGAVTTHEGYLSNRAARALDAADDPHTPPAKAIKPELTQKLENYIALHRHALVRTRLLGAPQMALALIGAHLLAGSSLWSVKADPQRTLCASTTKSVAQSAAHADFEAARADICTLLDMPFDASPLVTTNNRSDVFADMFAKLTRLAPDDLAKVLSFLMAESLEAGSIGVELAGNALAIDAAESWQVDEGFFELLRDKTAINAMLAETRGDAIAKANQDQTRNQQIEALKTGLDKRNAPWVPAYLRFPFATYTDKPGGQIAMFNGLIPEPCDTPEPAEPVLDDPGLADTAA